jgi:hypothetical protein
VTNEVLFAVTSAALTAMSTIVAAVALIFSFRQNVGWKPILLVKGNEISNPGDYRYRFTMKVAVEVWNRRRYPVILRSFEATVSGVELVNQNPMDNRDEPRFVRSNRVACPMQTIVSPSEQESWDIACDFQDQFMDSITPEFVIQVHYFDPYRNREDRLTLTHKFFYPHLGWDKSPAQREAIRRQPRPWEEEAADPAPEQDS